MEPLTEYAISDNSLSIDIKENVFCESSNKINKQIYLTDDDIRNVNEHGFIALRDIYQKKDEYSITKNIKNLFKKHKSKNKDNIIFVTPETNFKLWDEVPIDLIPSESLFISPSFEYIYDEKDTLNNTRNFLEEISLDFKLGGVELIMEDENSSLPTFNIKVPDSLSPDERIELSDKIFDRLYSYFEENNKLDELGEFFFRLALEE